MTTLEESIRSAREAIDRRPGDQQFQLTALDNLANLLGDRYESTGNAADLEEAVRIARLVIKLASDNHPKRALWLNNLGSHLRNQYLSKGAMIDLDDSIQVGRQVTDLTPVTHPFRLTFLNNLANRLGDRYTRIGEVTDLEEAIQIVGNLIDSVPEDHPDRATFLHALGNSLETRYFRTGVVFDLEKALQVLQQAVNLTSDDSHALASRLNDLAIALDDQYVRYGAVADLENMIDLAQRAVDVTPSEHPSRSKRLNNLSNHLWKRYSRLGAMVDLDESVQIGRKAILLTPKDHPDLPMWLSNLGIRLADRYERVGAIADLEEAIRVARQAVDLTPNDHIERTRWLDNLGNRLTDWYLRTGTLSSLDEAIAIAREANMMIANDHSKRWGWLNNLAIRLVYRFKEAGTIADLREAIRVTQEVIASMPEDDPNRVVMVSNYGCHLHDQYLSTRSIDDLDEAIRISRQALNLTPQGHPDRARGFGNLGMELEDRYLKAGAISDREEAMTCHRFVLNQLSWPPLGRLLAGKKVFKLCIDASDWEEAYESSSIAISLVPRMLSRSLQNPDRQYMMAQIVGLACDATAAVFHIGKSALTALQLLEIGRGGLATSLQDIRTDVLDLHKTHPELAEQFTSLRDELEQPIIQNHLSVKEGQYEFSQEGAGHRYDKGRMLDNLISEIRLRPGFESFLLPPSQNDMEFAARCGPIIVINVSKYRCDAIVVESHQIRSLQLPCLHIKDIETKAAKGNLGDPEVLEWLWDVVADPILQALGFFHSPSNDDVWPHIWWIPTGILSKFPLHAAGYHKERSGRTVLDRVMSSYSSSIKAILYSRPQHSAKSEASTLPQALVVAMQHTRKHQELPSAQEEAAVVREICNSMGLDTVEPGQRKREIVSHLPDAHIFHFAGHGRTEKSNPSESSLLLEDWETDPLKVADLFEMSLRERSPFLAYLSACGTGEIHDPKFLDESIHLISACQLSGFRHVIGTLWDVNDDICVDMARIIYEKIKDGNMTDESVCQGLHQASLELRESWLDMVAMAESGFRKDGDVTVTLTGDKISSPQMYGGTGGYNESFRDAELYDEDGIASWVPYVHYGV